MNTHARYSQISEKVMSRIAGRRLARARTAAIAHGTLLAATLVALIPALQYASASAARSGFSAYLSLIVSDGGSVAAYWKDFAMTIVESAPIMAGALVLGILLAFAYSARRMAADIGRLRIAGV